jgi:hypothetical protein
MAPRSFAPALLLAALARAQPAVIVAEVASATTFRLGVRFNGWATQALASPSLNPSSWSPAPSTPVAWGGMSGVQTSFGALLTDGTTRWALYDAQNNTLVSSNGAPTLNNASGTTADAGVVLPVAGASAANGPDRQCLGNGYFGPTFYYNRDAGLFAFATSAWDYDPDYHHCYPVSFSGAIGARARDTCDTSQRKNGTDVTNPVRSAKYPNGIAGATTLEQCCGACNSDPTCTAWVWSDGSNPDPNGSCWPLAGFDTTTSKQGRVFGGAAPAPPPPPQQAWWSMGQAADWYLAPAPQPLAFTRVFYELTGAPAIPPRHALGFLCTYWGYRTMEEVEGYMVDFRDGAFPVDSFIMDYDWWNNPGDCSNTPGQGDNCDFSYDPVMFGPHTFVHKAGSTIPNATTTDAPSLLAHFHKDINMRFSGIRKPRTYSNFDLSNSSGWLLPNSFDVGAGDSNWNMSAPGWTEWYVANHLHFLRDGIDYWWNDEGETQWFTYTFWNAAQQKMVDQVKPGKRHFTINRSFQAAMQTFPAITWTGDRQDCSHKTVLTFTTAGQLYTACDMTAPSASVLVRQYQNAVFLPIMRTHAMHGTPRFPFLWGPDAEPGFRHALEMRYHFLPHILSLCYLARATGRPLALPASYIFPDDASFPVALGDATYMFGDALLPADVSTSNGPDPDENTTHVNIPPGIWFAFNSTATVAGPITDLTYTDVPLTTLVLFVRAGAVLALNRDVVQFSDAIGGALELHVYGGRDGSFELVEDDGDTLTYQADPDAATRRTSFAWSDATRTLSWTVAGAFGAGANLYTTAYPVLFTSNASAPVFAAPQALGKAGSVSF